ncbi:MAG: N-acetyl sugar amidotransferase [Candidatus Omnitrophica bacterium]|nr:N-acetyl sugar amidotransferase [Candidatus Omnitrophota bacterium]
MKYCTRCLMPETRPRITFNKDGVCNACCWAEEKKAGVDWKTRWKYLEELCDKYRNRSNSKFDCILPVSGGKDSSYVAYMMKEKMGMRTLGVTVRPPLEFEIGKKNLENFIKCGYDHIHVTPNPEVGRVIDREYFIKRGQGYFQWLIALQTVIFKIAVLLDIPFVMFGEEGETEYGGTSKLKQEKGACYDQEYSMDIYLSGFNPQEMIGKFSEKELYWWLFPSREELNKLKPAVAHWSYFENWDPYEHYLLAKEKYGLQEETERCIGTYGNFAQTDTSLYVLQTYLMYLKYGFGRCSQDVGIDIRRGSITRKQAVELVKRYDGEYPEPYIEEYLKYFRMTKEEFDATLDGIVNKKIFRKENGRWVPVFTPH